MTLTELTGPPPGKKLKTINRKKLNLNPPHIKKKTNYPPHKKRVNPSQIAICPIDTTKMYWAGLDCPCLIKHFILWAQ